jgi:hypothetical protein
MILGQALRLPDKIRVQKMLNRRINSCRASIACAGFIRLSTLSRRSRSIAASSRTSLLRAFHFAYLPKPMPSARSPEMIQTVMSVEVTRSIGKRKSRLGNPSEIVFLFGTSSSKSTQLRASCLTTSSRLPSLLTGRAGCPTGRDSHDGCFTSP